MDFLLAVLGLLLSLCCLLIGVAVMIVGTVMYEKAEKVYDARLQELASRYGKDLSALRAWSVRRPFARTDRKMNTIVLWMLNGDDGAKDYLKHAEWVCGELTGEQRADFARLFEECFRPLSRHSKTILMGPIILLIGAMPSIVQLVV